MKFYGLFFLVFIIQSCSMFENEIDYNTDVKPILNKNCIACHGGVKKQGGFSILFEEEAFAKTKSGKAAIIPYKPEESSFIQRLTSHDKEERMPYEMDPLSEKEIEILTMWVKQGAKWGNHWAYQDLKSPQIPSYSWWRIKKLMPVVNTWEKNEIDLFIRKKQKEIGLVENPIESSSSLLRRVYLDIVGISPKGNEYFKYADLNELNYDLLVDSLLSDDKFGEKWGSMWLDLARYSDTKGYEKDEGRSIWKYRDYVIQSFNKDKPYDQFIREQLAGDLLEKPTEETYIATAFHRNTANNDEGGTVDEEFRTAAILDRVNTTWEAIQGTSFSCVQCHSHPYDPIKHEEYYQYMAYFNNTSDEDTPDDSPFYRHFEEMTDSKVDSLLKLIQDPKTRNEWTRTIRFLEPKILPHDAAIIDNGALQDSKYLTIRNKGGALFKDVNFSGSGKILIAYGNKNDSPTQVIWRDGGPKGKILHKFQLNGTKSWGWTNSWENAIISVPNWIGQRDIYWELSNSGLKKDEKILLMGYWIPLPETVENIQKFNDIVFELIQEKPKYTTPVLLENLSAYNRSTHLFERGSWLSPGKIVERDIPSLFKSSNKIKNRLDLANWMVSSKNPLTSRVYVNRIWEQIFGLGIVETLEDFGSQGLAPTNQPLLDYLAYKFQTEFNYSTKKLIKYILQSSTYQQSARIQQENLDKDPFNIYLSHFPRVRLTPEQLRDQGLYWSDLLSEKKFGPSVMPYQPEGVWNQPYSGMKWKTSEGEDQFRRAIYTYWRRSSPYPTMINFDAGMREICLSRRIRTNTPLQALNTLNDPVFLQMAENMAKNNLRNKEFIQDIYLKMIGEQISKENYSIYHNLYEKSFSYYQNNPEDAKILMKSCLDTLENKNFIEIASKTVVINTLLNIDLVLNKP